jgi:hypothetical protein
LDGVALSNIRGTMPAFNWGTSSSSNAYSAEAGTSGRRPWPAVLLPGSVRPTVQQLNVDIVITGSIDDLFNLANMLSPTASNINTSSHLTSDRGL